MINLREKLKYVLGSVENIEWKWENVDDQHFLLFPQRFQKVSFSRSLKVNVMSLIWYHTSQRWFSSLQNDNILLWFKFKAFTDKKLHIYKCIKNWNFWRKGRKHCGKRKKCWLPAITPLPAISPFPTMFSKRFFLMGLWESGLCGKELNPLSPEHGIRRTSGDVDLYGIGISCIFTMLIMTTSKHSSVNGISGIASHLISPIWFFWWKLSSLALVTSNILSEASNMLILPIPASRGFKL